MANKHKGLFIAAMVLSILASLYWLSFGFGGFLFGSIPTVIAAINMYKFSNLTNEELIDKKAAIVGWIWFYVLYNFIAMILLLVVNSSIKTMMWMKVANVETEEVKKEEDVVNENSSTFYKEIKDLQKLKEEGLITEEEFILKKKKILGES